MSQQPPPLQLAKTLVDHLRRAGLLVLAAGGGDRVVRELGQQIEPALGPLLARMSLQDQRVLGEVTSTFGDETADEMVEDLVAELCETLLDSEGVEDIFADDPTMQRAIFKILSSEFVLLAETHEDEPAPPISVRLDSLGYVAAHAAQAADRETLQDVLDRAAEAAKSELARYDDGTRTAFFEPLDPDPERRIELEAAIEEELSELVDLGVLELPSVHRLIELGRSFDRAEQKSLFRGIDQLAQRHLSGAVCPGSWTWATDGAIRVTFTPLCEPDPKLCDKLAEDFRRGLQGLVAGRPSGDQANDNALLALARAAFSMEGSLRPATAAPPGDGPAATQAAPITQRSSELPEPFENTPREAAADKPAKPKPVGAKPAEPKAKPAGPKAKPAPLKSGAKPISKPAAKAPSKPAAKTPAAKKPAAKTPAAKKPAAKKPAAKTPAAKKPAAKLKP